MTQRTGWLLNEEELKDWLDDLVSDGRSLIGPVDVGGLRVFRAVTAASDLSLEPGKARWSPKEHLFPRSEKLYSYALRGGDVELHDPPRDDGEKVLFGLRCCDAAGLSRLDAVFLSGEVDPFYARRRERTAVVSVACEAAEPGCFCTAVGGSPAGEQGSDVMVIPLDGAMLVYTTSSKGADLVDPGARGWAEASVDDWQRAEGQTRSVAESMAANPLDPGWSSALEGAFDDDVWARFGEGCLSCSICAYVCPSCSCFDVSQEGDTWCGTQSRCWDSCTFSRFTRHASGHDPRPDQAARYRQRLLHKFAYTSEGDRGEFRCVGCGRCIALCPAGIDIHRAVREVVATSPGGDVDARG